MIFLVKMNSSIRQLLQNTQISPKWAQKMQLKDKKRAVFIDSEC